MPEPIIAVGQLYEGLPTTIARRCKGNDLVTAQVAHDEIDGPCPWIAPRPVGFGFPLAFVQVAQFPTGGNAVTINDSTNEMIGWSAVPPTHIAAIVVFHICDESGPFRNLFPFFTK